MNSLAIKLISVLFGLSAVCGVSYKIYTLIQENAVLEASVEARDKAMSTYANEVNNTIEQANREIEERNIQIETLQNAYEDATLKEDEFDAKIDKHDWEEMAFRHPKLFDDAFNTGLNELFDEIRTYTGFTENRESSGKGETTKTDTSKSTTSEDEVDKS